MGDVDHNGTWFCNGCWEAWEEERKEQRLTSGKLFPEDRELWYATTRPAKLYDFEDDLRLKISLADQFNGDLPWFKVDIPSLCIEVFDDLEISSKPNPHGEVSVYSSLRWKTTVLETDNEFSMDFSVPVVTLTEADIFSPEIYFPAKLTSHVFEKFRTVTRAVRARKREALQEVLREQLERENLKSKQQSELAQKQKDLVQLALKRAAAQKKLVNPWSSKQTNAYFPTPALRLTTMLPEPVPVRSGVPAAMPGWSSAMTAPPVTFRGGPFVADPWAVEKTNVWSSPPDAKRVKEETTEEQSRERMTRLGVPFKHS